VVHGRLRAITIMIAAVAVFSFMDMTLKLLAAHYPPMQVAVLRGAASLPFTLLPVLISGRCGTSGHTVGRCTCFAAPSPSWSWAASSTR
jgi:hypothetical protein